MSIDTNLLSLERNPLLPSWGRNGVGDRRLWRRRNISLQGFVPTEPTEAAEIANPILSPEVGSNVSVPIVPVEFPGPTDAWTVLESMMGSIEGPVDWSSELDHYLYGSPKRGEPSP